MQQRSRVDEVAGLAAGTHRIVWFSPARGEWQKGSVVARDEQAVHLDVVDAATQRVQRVTLPANTPLLEANTVPPDGLPDMLRLDHLHEPAILNNIRLRFLARKVYTYTGKICVAVNPYEWLPLYAADIKARYHNQPHDKNPPHLYAVADCAYREMLASSQNQSILVSGESGSGKTESTKIVMDYLAEIGGLGSQSKSEGGVAHIQRVLKTNPLLEAFGNAKTLRNDNSSRFGKFVQLLYDAQGVIIGARIETYLLEKTRVVRQAEGERNYHVFYQMLCGMSAEEKTALLLRADAVPADFACLNDVPMAGDEVDDVKGFAETRSAMEMMGMGETEQHAVFSVLAAVLLIGEVHFEGDGESSRVANSPVLANVARLLQVDGSALGTSLCSRRMSTAGETYLVPRSVRHAESARDALAKALYGRLFLWLVKKVNGQIAPQRGSVVRHEIGILDIFGFEHFQENWFEQFCINFANEKLQQQFCQSVFKSVQEEYAEEGVDWQYVEFDDNQDCVDLIENKMGIITVLDEECMVNGSDKNLTEKLHTLFRSNKRWYNMHKLRHKEHEFGIQHYAGLVVYNTEGFVDKNLDILTSDITEVLERSECGVVAACFSKTTQPSAPQRSLGNRNKGRDLFTVSVASQFRKQLRELYAIITTTGLHYVRCIKPNSLFSSREFETASVLSQLRCLGVLEAVRISRAAYPNRMLQDVFLRRYCFLIGNQAEDGTPVYRLLALNRLDESRAMCEKVLRTAEGIKHSPVSYQIGHTRVYVAHGILDTLDRLVSTKLTKVALAVQAQWRKHVAVVGLRQVRTACVVLQTKHRCRTLHQRFLAHQRSALLLQTLLRRQLAVREVARVRRLAAVLRLQSLQRLRTVRAWFVLQKRAAVTVQSACRRCFHQLRLPGLLEEARRKASLEFQLAELQSQLQAEVSRRENMEQMAESVAKQALPPLALEPPTPPADWQAVLREREAQWEEERRQLVEAHQFAMERAVEAETDRENLKANLQAQQGAGGNAGSKAELVLLREQVRMLTAKVEKQQQQLKERDLVIENLQGFVESKFNSEQAAMARNAAPVRRQHSDSMLRERAWTEGARKTNKPPRESPLVSPASSSRLSVGEDDELGKQRSALFKGAEEVLQLLRAELDEVRGLLKDEKARASRLQESAHSLANERDQAALRAKMEAKTRANTEAEVAQLKETVQTLRREFRAVVVEMEDTQRARSQLDEVLEEQGRLQLTVSVLKNVIREEEDKCEKAAKENHALKAQLQLYQSLSSGPPMAALDSDNSESYTRPRRPSRTAWFGRK